MSTDCNLHFCCHEEKKELFIKNGCHILECKKCSHRFVEVSEEANHISKVYSDTYFFDGKAGYPNYLDEEEILVSSGRRYAKLISKFTSPGNLLDVGCAAGFIMSGFEEAGWNCYGIEPNETMASFSSNVMNHKVQTANLEEFKADKKFDLVCLIEVIGHFYDLNKAMQNISDMITDGGLVLVESWNMKSTMAKLCGEKWHEYSPPSVLNWLSDSTLSQLFSNAGFQLIELGYSEKRINIKHALSLLNEHLTNFVFKRN